MRSRADRNLPLPRATLAALVVAALSPLVHARAIELAKPRLIAGFPGVVEVVVVDLDRDGDRDLVSWSTEFGRIFWFENLDGAGTFSPRREVSDVLESVDELVVADLDGDHDLDLLAGSRSEDRIVWFPNLDGTQAFGAPLDVAPFVNGPRAVLAADLDGDGDLDVVAAVEGHRTIEAFENLDGLGSFGPGRVLENGVNPRNGTIAIEAGDLDGDGDLDLAWAASALSGFGMFTEYDNRLGWHENRGEEGFFLHELVRNFTHPNTLEELELVDLDGNGGTDLLVHVGPGGSSSDPGGFQWYSNRTGAGDFGEARDLPGVPGRVSAVVGVDLDGDGDQDVLTSRVSLQPSDVVWLENVDGSLEFAPPVALGEPVVSPSGVHAADLDGDGDRDVVIVSRTSGRISWLDNAGAAVDFSEGGVAAQGTPGLNLADELELADLDGDGRVDVLAAGLPEVVWYRALQGEGGLTFGAARGIAASTGITPPLHVTDLDADGAADVLIGSADLLLSEYDSAAAGFSVPRVLFDAPGRVLALDTADVDGDGDLDLLCGFGTAQGAEPLAWLPNLSGQGVLGDARPISPDVVGLSSVRAADLDGDGDVDAVVAAGDDRALRWFANLPDERRFTEQLLVKSSPFYADLALAEDLDGDGDLDLVLASGEFPGGLLAWFENRDGAGDFGPQRTLASSFYRPGTVAVADLDLDGDPDLVFPGVSDRRVAWCENLDGLGGFAPPVELSADFDGIDDVATADLDGDGDPDVVVTNGNRDRVAWFENLVTGASAR